MATGIPDKGRQVEACKKETLEDAVEYLLEEYDLKGANPYTMQGGKYTLAQLVGWLSKHKQMKNKTVRRRSDILRNVLNEMMSIIRVGSTRKAMYAFDSAGVSEARKFMESVLRELLRVGGEAKWNYLQELVKVGKVGGLTHLEFNSAVNYLVDNGVVEKKGLSAQRVSGEEGTSEIQPDSRRVVCTAKAWGWESGDLSQSVDWNLDLYIDGTAFEVKDGWGTKDYQEIVVGGSAKKTHSIVLTERTSTVLDELDGMLNSLPDTDIRKPANINRSTIIEVALWTLYRNVSIKEGGGSDQGAKVAMPKDQLKRLVVEIIEQMSEN